MTVGPAVELDAALIENDDDFSIDLSGSVIRFDFMRPQSGEWTVATFNGWEFVDASGTVPEIVDFSLGRSFGVQGLDDSDIAYGPNYIAVNLSGVTIAGPDEYLQINVVFLPEPASTTLAFAALGTCGVIVVLRRLRS